MTSLRRSSRADRRRTACAVMVPERRTGTASEFGARSQLQGEELLIQVRGAVTAATVGRAEKILQAHIQTHSAAVLVVIDLQDCCYMETPGLSLLFDLKRSLEAQGRSLILQNPSRAVLRILNITRMGRIFRFRMTTTDHEKIPIARTPQPVRTPAVEADGETSQA